MQDVSEIDRITDHLRDTMAAYAVHIEQLRLENPDAVPIQEAILEKAVTDAVTAAIERALELEDDSGADVIAALDRLEQVVLAATPSMNWEALIQ
jgi:hypothetical protein